jgi:hypothetical protein
VQSPTLLLRPLAFGLLFPAGTLLLSCTANTQDSLFPLATGHRWTYDVRIEMENHTVERDVRQISIDGKAEIDGTSAWRRRSADGVEWFVRSDETGIYRVGTKTDLDDEIMADAQKRYVLKLPLAVGTSWQHPTAPYLLRRRQEFPPEIRHTHPQVPMVYTIEATTDALETRVGRFERCVRVRGKAVLKLFADPVVGWRDLPLTTTEWYCPGPGLVRLVREEPAQSTFLVGGTLTMDLMQWQ